MLFKLIGGQFHEVIQDQHLAHGTCLICLADIFSLTPSVALRGYVFNPLVTAAK